MIFKEIYGHLFMMAIGNNDILHKRKSHQI